jgi:hypothetical protein
VNKKMVLKTYEKEFLHNCPDKYPNEYTIKWELPDRYCLQCKRCHAEKIIFFEK